MSLSVENELYFDGQGEYPCPVCYFGRVSALALMDVLACSHCRNMFETSSNTSFITMVSSTPILQWQWDGRAWLVPDGQGVRPQDLAAAVALVVVPTLLVGASGYAFRPQADVALGWFPIVWTGLTFVCHLTFILQIFVGYYQLSVVTVLKSLLMSKARAVSHLLKTFGRKK